MKTTGVPISEKAYERMRKVDGQTETGFAPETGRTYSAGESIKANLKEAVEDLKDLNPKHAWDSWMKGANEMKGALAIFSPIWLPLKVLSAPIRAVKDAVLDNIMHAGIAIYHKIAGKTAVSAGADAVE